MTLAFLLNRRTFEGMQVVRQVLQIHKAWPTEVKGTAVTSLTHTTQCQLSCFHTSVQSFQENARLDHSCFLPYPSQFTVNNYLMLNKLRRQCH
jgi:hypothetical protein